MRILIGHEDADNYCPVCVHPDGKIFAHLEGNWREYEAIHSADVQLHDNYYTVGTAIYPYNEREVR